MTPSSVRNLRQLVLSAEQRLREISDAEALVRPEADQWSAKEILGHLIDSAAHNHLRFVEAQLYDDLNLSGYEQERWVEIQCYREESWSELIALWKTYNLHLAHVLSSIPEEALWSPPGQHWQEEDDRQAPEGDEPVTLGFLAEDYVRHLREHLDQIFTLVREYR